MRQPRDQRWSVEISARAWQQLGAVPGEVFRDIKRALDEVAALVGSDEADRAGIGSTLNHSLSLVVGQYAALYQIDLVTRTVRLQEVTRRITGEGEHYDD